jgi:hypothetical protein
MHKIESSNVPKNNYTNPMGVNAAGRREADGDYRDEGDGTRPHSFQLDAASCGTTKAFMGRPRRNRHHSEYADQAGNLQLQSLVTHQHGNHRV